MKASPQRRLYFAGGKKAVLNAAQSPARLIWIGLGSNIQGTWGNSAATLTKAIQEIGKLRLHLVRRSPVYLTPPLGYVRQPAYLNMVIGVSGSIGPFALLRSLKRLEAAAGRRRSGYWRPRPLDLDILDHAGRVLGCPSGPRADGSLVLPHPEMHKRGFVLVPLADVAPAWRHPRLGASARQLLARRPALARGIRRLPEQCRADRRRAAQP